VAPAVAVVAAAVAVGVDALSGHIIVFYYYYITLFLN
jgi:hypothetical protein